MYIIDLHLECDGSDDADDDADGHSIDCGRKRARVCTSTFFQVEK